MPQSYTVKGGDNLSKIAKQFGVKYQDISGYRSGNPNLIFPGEVLNIPGGAPAPAQAPAAPAATPQTKAQVTPYLQNYQAQLRADRDAPKVKSQFETDLASARGELDKLKLPQKTDEQRFADIEKFTTPDMERPEIPSLKGEFFELREQYGLEGLEEQSTQLQDDIIAIENRLRERIGLEADKPVALNVISGRISEAERQEFTRLDYLNRSATRLNNQMASAQNMISTVMQLTQQDYGNARDSYNDQLQQKLNTYKLFRGEVESDRDFTMKIMSSKLDLSEKLYEIETRQIERAQDMAKANLEIMSNAIADGNIDYADLDQGTKAEISKLEAQSGLPIGFTARLRSTIPNAEVISTTKRQDASGMNYVDVITRDRKTGKISVQSQATGVSRLPAGSGGGGGGGGDDENELSFTQRNQYVDKALKILTREDVLGRQRAGNAPSDWKGKEDDFILSDEEMRRASDRVIGLVGDKQLGIEIFDTAWQAGGFQRWGG